MKNIRLIELGTNHRTDIGNLCCLLNGTQNPEATFHFLFNEDRISLEDKLREADGTYDESRVREVVYNYAHDHHYTEYPLAIGDYPFTDEIIMNRDNRSSVISTHDWSSYSKSPLVTGLEFLTAQVMTAFFLPNALHMETNSCPNDYCDNREDIDMGIKEGAFCYSCRNLLLSELDKNKITLPELIGIERILDHVANRKICLVIMPFRSKFAKVYRVLKDTIEGVRDQVTQIPFKCIRADEIFSSVPIMHIIHEQMGRAEIIIADLTSCNPNVFYELGYAHGIGKNTICITQKKKDVPFDLKHRQFLLYYPRNLKQTLSAKIKRYLK